MKKIGLLIAVILLAMLTTTIVLATDNGATTSVVADCSNYNTYGTNDAVTITISSSKDSASWSAKSGYEITGVCVMEKAGSNVFYYTYGPGDGNHTKQEKNIDTVGVNYQPVTNGGGDNGNGNGNDQNVNVTFCHRNQGDSGYELKTEPAQAVINAHLSHQWGQDIIPFFEFNGVEYGPLGVQAILANGCVVPDNGNGDEPSKGLADADFAFECGLDDINETVTIVFDNIDEVSISGPQNGTFTSSPAVLMGWPAGDYTVAYDYDADEYDLASGIRTSFSILACDDEEKIEDRKEEVKAAIQATSADPNPDFPAGGQGPTLIGTIAPVGAGISSLAVAWYLLKEKFLKK